MGSVFITGASGRLGRAVLAVIPDAIPLVRRKTGLQNEIVSDFAPEHLKRVFQDADVIIHLAGSLDFLDMKKAREGNVWLTKKVVEAAPLKTRIIFSSSISVYGKKLARIPADERTAVMPDTPYAQTKLEAEGIVAAEPNHVILRIGPMYGPGFTEYFRILQKIEHGRMSIIGDGENRIPFVHVADVSAAIRSAVGKGKGVYVLTGDCLTQKRVYEIAAKALGVQPPSKHASAALAMLAAYMGIVRSALFGGNPSFQPEDVAVLSSDRAFDCSKAMRELGFSPRPLEKGIWEMVRLYKQNCELPRAKARGVLLHKHPC